MKKTILFSVVLMLPLMGIYAQSKTSAKKVPAKQTQKLTAKDSAAARVATKNRKPQSLDSTNDRPLIEHQLKKQPAGMNDVIDVNHDIAH